MKDNGIVINPKKTVKSWKV